MSKNAEMKKEISLLHYLLVFPACFVVVFSAFFIVIVCATS